MAGGIINKTFCRFLCMEDTYGIKECCNILNLILLLDRPNNVKDIKLMYNVKEEDVEEHIVAAYINIWIATLEDSFILDVFCDAESYDNKPRSEAEDNLQFHTYEILQRWIDNKEYEHFWKSVDFENKDWKRKEE